MSQPSFHTMVPVRPPAKGVRVWLRCLRCNHEGDLTWAAQHSVDKQLDMTGQPVRVGPDA